MPSLDSAELRNRTLNDPQMLLSLLHLPCRCSHVSLCCAPLHLMSGRRMMIVGRAEVELSPHPHLLATSSAVSVVDVFALVNVLVILASRNCWNRRRRGKHLRDMCLFLALPLKLLKPFAALSPNVFGQLDQAKNILLLCMSIIITMPGCKTETYVAQVLDDIEEIISLLV